MVSLYSDSSMAVAILQASKGRNSHIQACAIEIWLACAVYMISPSCAPTPPITVYSAVQMLSAGSIWVVYISTEYMST